MSTLLLKSNVYTNIDCVLTDMVHGVPDGFEFWHKGVTTDDLQIAKGIWLERGNLRREDSVVIIDANNITMRMGVYWESFMGAHPDADVCDVVMRIFNSDLYHPCSKDFSIEMMKLDWHCVETQWLMQKLGWFWTGFVRGGLRPGRTKAVTRSYAACDLVKTVRQNIENLMSDTRSVDKSRTRCGWDP